jgi:TonB family protein
MSKFVSLVLALLFAPALIAAQKTDGALPEYWGKYSVGDKDASVLFPGLPIKVADRSQKCNGLEADNYGIFDDGAVYVLTISYKIKPPGDCQIKREFSSKNSEARVGAYIYNDKLPVDSGRDKTGLTLVKFKTEDTLIKLYNDPENSRWFELRVVGADESKAAVKAFLNSLEISKKPLGAEIGEGRTGGGPVSTAALLPTPKPITTPIPTLMPKPPPVSDGVGSGAGIGNGAGIGGTGPGGNSPVTDSRGPLQGVKVVLMATPPYTEDARKNQVSGVVLLKIVFNANGSIGSISPVRGLSYGLTEQAIAAARKIVFIPAQRNGVYVSVAKAIQYNFSLY